MNSILLVAAFIGVVSCSGQQQATQQQLRFQLPSNRFTFPQQQVPALDEVQHQLPGQNQKRAAGGKGDDKHGGHGHGGVGLGGLGYGGFGRLGGLGGFGGLGGLGYGGLGGLGYGGLGYGGIPFGLLARQYPFAATTGASPFGYATGGYGLGGYPFGFPYIGLNQLGAQPAIGSGIAGLTGQTGIVGTSGEQVVV